MEIFFEQLYGRSVGDSVFYFAHGFKKVWDVFLFLTEMGGKIILKGNEKRDCETMKKVLLIRYGEIALKGQNRKYFEDTLKNNIAARLKNYKDVHIRKGQARIEVHFENSNMDELIDCIRDVFGIAYISKALIAESNMEDICAGADELYEAGKTFKIESRRGDKTFAFTSPEISARVGGYILKKHREAKVDVHTPEQIIEIEVRDIAYIYSQSIKGRAGLPTSTSGKGVLLLSGGIDSPVAGYMMASRGMSLRAVYFHSSPYTSIEAKQKVIDLAKKLDGFAPGLVLYVVPFTELQESMIEHCDVKYLTILMRRYMMRIAEKIAYQCRSGALITGESLGQVASQTVESIGATNAVCTLPVLRPLIGMDKLQIIEIAKDIGTFETSILPYEDCCTLFSPKHPQTKPKIENVETQEAKVADVAQGLIMKAVSEAEVIEF